MTDKKELQFEKGLQELEGIVRDLESGELTLDDALKRYEEGIKYSRALQGKLEEATKKIEVLSKQLDGTLEAKPLELGEEKKNTPAKKKISKTDSVDLLI